MFAKSTLLLVAAQLSAVYAHGFVKQVTVDGKVFKGPNPFNPNDELTALWPYSGGNGPINNVNSADIACNKVIRPGQLVAEAKPGSTVIFDWNGSSFWPAGDAGLGPQNHHGPVMNYLARCPGRCADAKANDLEFVKIQQVGRVQAAPIPGVWGSDLITKAGSTFTFQLPNQLADGEYVLKHDILALHNAQNNDAQFYPTCTNIKIVGGNADSIASAPKMKFPGGYKADDPNLHVNLFDGSLSNKDYVVPGGPVFTPKKKRDTADLTTGMKKRQNDYTCRFARSTSAARRAAGCA